MSDLREKLKRQTEILGLCLQRPKELRSSDLEAEFERDHPTIVRDLSYLREMGIDIHSTKKGIDVDKQIPLDTLRELIVQYIGLLHSTITYDRGTEFLVQRLKEKALTFIVTLQRGIEHGTMVAVDYEKKPGHIEKGKVLCPLLLFQGDHEWRLLAIHDGVRKQFILSKMRNVTPTAKTFKKLSNEELHPLLKSSWSNWLGGPMISIQLELSPVWVERIGHRQFTANQKLIMKPDGSAILHADVNGLHEVAAWVVTRGEGVKVLKPKELRKAVIDLAKRSLKNYE